MWRSSSVELAISCPRGPVRGETNTPFSVCPREATEVSGLELSGWPKIQGQGGQLRCKSS